MRKYRRHRQLLNGATNERDNDNELPYTIPTITFEQQECSLTAREIESRLRKHLELEIKDLWAKDHSDITSVANDFRTRDRSGTDDGCTR